MSKQMFRITYRSEIEIEADDFQDAKNQFEDMEEEEYKEKSEFIEIVSIEDENYCTEEK